MIRWSCISSLKSKVYDDDNAHGNGKSARLSAVALQPPRWNVGTSLVIVGLAALSSVSGYSPQVSPAKISVVISDIGKASDATSLVTTARLIQLRRLQQRCANNSEKRCHTGLFGKKQVYEKPTFSDDSWTANLFGESYNMDDMKFFVDDNSMAHKVKEQNIAQLQAATGSEVLDMELNLQMDAAKRRSLVDNNDQPLGSQKADQSSSSYATAFIDSHLSDATTCEKFAMRMIPSQLPAPLHPLNVCEKITKKTVASSKRKKSQPKRKENISHISDKTATTSQPAKSKTEKEGTAKYLTQKVSRDEEIRLAQIIQQGANIHRLKAEFEAKHEREISRSEWTKIAKLDSPTTLRRLVSSYRTSKNKLVTANLGLVYAVVRQGPYLKKNGVTEDELVQEGTLGLIRATELFDPDRGLRFSTYATIWIKGVLGNTKISQTIVLPSREKTKWNKIQRAQADLCADGSQGSEAPTAQEISKVTQIPECEVAEIMYKMPRATNMLSLDYQYSSRTRSGSEETKSTGLFGSKALQEEDSLAETLQLKADIVAALAKNLDPREARLMRLRYGLQDGKTRTIVECAECMGLSRQRVQQLAVKCLEKLREADDSKSLQEYLLTVA